MEKKREPRPATQAPAKKGDSSKVILIIVILILLGGIGYLVFTNQKTEEKVVAAQKVHEADSLKIASKIKEIENLQKDIQALIDEKNELKLSNDSLLTALQELESLKQQVRNRNIKIRDLDRLVTKYKGDYNQSRASYDSLLVANADLKLKKDSLLSLNNTKDDTIRVLHASNEEFAKKVALASVLHAENIKITVYSMKGKEEKFVPIYKAKTVGKLKIAFDLAENLVAPKGDKEIYFRIIEPSGSTIFEGDKIFMLDGKEAFYTDKQTIGYNNSKQQVAFMYNKGSAYKPGKYTIELFEEGHKIGDTHLTLR